MDRYIFHFIAIPYMIGIALLASLVSQSLYHDGAAAFFFNIIVLAWSLLGYLFSVARDHFSLLQWEGVLDFTLKAAGGITVIGITGLLMVANLWWVLCALIVAFLGCLLLAFVVPWKLITFTPFNMVRMSWETKCTVQIMVYSTIVMLMVLIMANLLSIHTLSIGFMIGAMIAAVSAGCFKVVGLHGASVCLSVVAGLEVISDLIAAILLTGEYWWCMWIVIVAGISYFVPTILSSSPRNNTTNTMIQAGG